MHVAFHSGTGAGETWVIVGSDSRLAVPSPDVFGSAQEVAGQRADVVLLVHRGAGRTTVVSVPRDMIVSPTSTQIERLALTLNTGPQALLDGLCATLGVAADHLAVITMKSFADIVDALGGLVVHIPYPIRDAGSGLAIPTAGAVRLNGVEALALVRSRTPQQLIGSEWVAADTVTGDGDRTQWAGRVFSAILASASSLRWNPVALQRVAWAATGGITTDSSTSLADLLSIANVNATVTDLPAEQLAQSLAVIPDSATYSTLVTAGLRTHCR